MVQKLEYERQSLRQDSEQQQQDFRLQLQWLQQHCQEAMQQERLEHAEQVYNTRCLATG